MIGKTLLVSALLVVFAAGQETKCCSYPLLTISISTANVTRNNFECSEPVNFSCSLAPSTLFKKVATVGMPGDVVENIEENIIKSDASNAFSDVVCDPEQHLWHADGQKKQYQRFYCAYQKINGKWIQNEINALLTALLVLAGSGVAQAIGKTAVPIQSFHANVSDTDFQCSEPIELTCNMAPSRTFVAVGIAGNQTVNGNPKQEELLGIGQGSIIANLECDLRKRVWKLKKNAVKKGGPYWTNVGCALMLTDGTWITM
ncbi:unnamed protein product [Caenorhabditis sp. 36 PRJEB53466]|nr:unnamed protein product [Caenorhabditis sp. 36 PRJEB53466]